MPSLSKVRALTVDGWQAYYLAVLLGSVTHQTVGEHYTLLLIERQLQEMLYRV